MLHMSLYSRVFGCTGSPSLLVGFLWFPRIGAALGWGVRAAPCGGFSCCRAQALGLQASVLVAHRLSSSWTRGLFPDQGLNPCPLYREADSYPPHH